MSSTVKSKVLATWMKIDENKEINTGQIIYISISVQVISGGM